MQFENKNIEDIRRELSRLYEVGSKHSSYQTLPEAIREHLSTAIDVKGKNELERMLYIKDKVRLKNKLVLDIGGNTGYFTFEALIAGVSFVNYFEGNHEHAQFVMLSSRILNKAHQINIQNQYFDFENLDKNGVPKVDVCFCLNVLHHIGDDFGNENISSKEAKAKIVKYVNKLSTICDLLVLQIGFNWKGDSQKPLFEYGTKAEMITFLENECSKNFQMLYTGIPEKTNRGIKYKDLNSINIKRDDSLGEFLNRPLFILKSL